MPTNIDGSVGLGVNETEMFNQLCPDGRMTLGRLYTVYGRWLKFKDTDRIDVVLATALSRKSKGSPIWLIIIAPSGDCKSEQIIAVYDPFNTKILHEITARSLVAGSRMIPDLAPELNGKIALIPDMAQLLKLHPNEKAMVWAQLRELYDGRAGRRTAMKEDPNYSNIRVTLIAGSTPSIDAQILVHQDLGTRELIYRVDEGSTLDIKDKVWNNEGCEEQMRRELNKFTLKFLEQHEIREDIEISEEIKEKIYNLVEYLRQMRAVAESDSYTGELLNIVYPESPTRCLKQLKILFKALKSLDDNYTDEKALEIVRHVVFSSILPIRQGIFDLLKKKNPLSTNEIVKNMRIGVKTAIKELAILWNLKILEREDIEEMNSYGKTFITRTDWTLAKNKIVETLVKI